MQPMIVLSFVLVIICLTLFVCFKKNKEDISSSLESSDTIDILILNDKSQVMKDKHEKQENIIVEDTTNIPDSVNPLNYII